MGRIVDADALGMRRQLRERDDIRHRIVLMHVSDQHIAVGEIDNARRRMHQRPDGAVGVVCLRMSDDYVSWSLRERRSVSAIQLPHSAVANLFGTRIAIDSRLD